MDRAQQYLKQLEQLRSMPALANQQQHVVIIGAGMAGLSSANELIQLGYKVTLIEADSFHIGGRVRTFRENNNDSAQSMYVELGAMRIPTSHTLTRFYAKEQGLTLRKFIQENEQCWAYIRNTRVQRNQQGLESLKRLFKLSPNEKNMTADDMWEKAVTSVVEALSETELKDLYNTSFQTKKLQDLDGISLLTAFQNSGLSQEAIEYLSSVYGVGTLLHSAFTEHLREEFERIWIDGFDEIEGGSDLLPKQLYQSIKNKVTLLQGAYVNKVEPYGNKVTSYYTDASKTQKQLESDWVICTVPLGALTGIDLTQVISNVKSRAIRQVSYDSSTKVVVKCSKRFWELNDGIYGGGSIWDGGLGHTWYPSDNAKLRNKSISNSPAYLLASYTWGQQARRIDALHQQDVKPFIIEQLKKIHPDLNDSDISSVIRWNWTNFSLASGAFAFFNPNEQSNYYAHLKSTDERFILAGEHCSLSHSWIQGALESSVDAVTQIYTQSI